MASIFKFRNKNRNDKIKSVEHALKRPLFGFIPASWVAPVLVRAFHATAFNNTILKLTNWATDGDISSFRDMNLAQELLNGSPSKEKLVNLAIAALDQNSIASEKIDYALTNASNKIVSEFNAQSQNKDGLEKHARLIEQTFADIKANKGLDDPLAQLIMSGNDLDIEQMLTLADLKAEALSRMPVQNEAIPVQKEVSAEIASAPVNPFVVSMAEFKAKLAEIDAMNDEEFEAHMADLQAQEEGLSEAAPRMSNFVQHHAMINHMVQEVENWDMSMGMPANADEDWNIAIVNGFYNNQIDLDNIGYLAAKKDYELQMVELNAEKVAHMSNMPWAEFVQRVSALNNAFHEDPDRFMEEIKNLKQEEIAEHEFNHYLSRFTFASDTIGESLEDIKQLNVNREDSNNELTAALLASFQANTVDVIHITELAEEAFALEMAMNMEPSKLVDKNENVSVTQEQVNAYYYKESQLEWFSAVEDIETFEFATKAAESAVWDNDTFERNVNWLSKYRGNLDARESQFNKIDNHGNENLTSFALHAERLADTWNVVKMYENDSAMMENLEIFDDLALAMFEARASEKCDWQKMTAIAGDIRYQFVADYMEKSEASVQEMMAETANEIIAEPTTQNSAIPTYGASSSTSGKQVKYNYM